MTLTIGKRSEQSNPGSSTNQTPVNTGTEQQLRESPQYEEITTGHVNQAGPSGVDGIVGNVTSPYVNVPISEIRGQPQPLRPNSLATEGIASSTDYEIPH